MNEQEFSEHDSENTKATRSLGVKPTPELSELSNPAYRVERAKLAIAAHTGEEYPDNEAETQLVDLLADMLHFADANNLDFARCERFARNHYLAEKGGAS